MQIEEVKSIFTSQKDFGSQPDQPRTVSPNTLSAIASTPVAVSRPPDLFTTRNGVDKEARQAEQQEPALRVQRELGNAIDGVAVASVSLKQHPLTTPNAKAFPTPFTTPTQTNALKHQRPVDVELKNGSRSEPPQKKRKYLRLRPRHTLGAEGFLSGFPHDSNHPPSPLFFSHSPGQRQRPILPHSFSSAEAIMLKKAANEKGGITTLKLARGSLSQASPPRSTSSAGSRASMERDRIPQSPGIGGTKQSAAQPGLQILGSVGIIELLEQDERPTFIVDIANPLNFSPGTPLQIVFANASLRAYDSVLDMVTGKADLDSPGNAVMNDFPEFKAWVFSFVRNNESLDICLPSFLYGGVTWTCSTLRKRFRLISGSSSSISAVIGSSNGGASNSSVLSERARGPSSLNSIANSPFTSTDPEPADYFGDAASPRLPTTSPDQLLPTNQIPVIRQAMLTSPSGSPAPEAMQVPNLEQSSFDWTRLPISAALPKHIQFARSIDWAKTPLGPIEDWAFDLRAMCNLIMGSPHAAAMYWGPEYIAIYNEAYILLAGQRHPTLMGQSYKTAWAEIWTDIDPYFQNAMESGQATMKDDDCLFVTRNGFLEESYFSWSIIPLIGEDGTVVGLYNPAFEKTRRKIAERRMLTLREIGEKTAAAREVKGFWGQVIKGLEYNEYDVPFVFLYSVSDDVDSDMSSMHSGSLSQAPQCVLEGTLGVPKDHKAAVSPLDLKSSDEGFAPYLRESMKTNRPVLLTTEDGTLSAELIEGLQWRGFGDPCRSAVVCPIHPTTGESILGFLVMGINPRRPYDDDYSLFIQLMSRQLATSMASVVLFEEEIRRGQRAARLAALDRQELSKQLDLRTQEAVESETKFTRMAEFAPVGMFIASSNGEMNYSNDTWWEITRHPRTENSANTWMDSVKDEDREQVRNIWKKLVEEKTAVTQFEFRFKTPWQDPTGNRSDTWVLMSAYPEKDENGALKSVFGSITNISQQKWAEDFQKRRMEEAIEMKRQQENFIDITSHEMRNPLSAILQCADEISSSLAEFRSSGEDSRTAQKLEDILENGVDAAQTIALCAQHQKRIVDDILTLSKLDSALLLVTPVDVQPVSVVQRALKMFEGEIESNDIAMEFRVEKTYLDLKVDWVKCDPSRLLQVLINLTTNAIKFTHAQTKRTIVVSIGASTERPQAGVGNHVSYFPTRSKRGDITSDEAEWGNGEELYLHFVVQDTGRGLDDNEKKLLFLRFSQASPRTHVQYGGSGLGLFISRELTELQGGEIGVASERGVGSTFAFYVKARRVDYIPADTPIAASLLNLRRNSSNSSVTVENRRNSSGKGTNRQSNSKAPPKRHNSTPRTSSIESNVLKVLIVEDNLVNQRVLQKQLRNNGMQVYVANHGVEALELLKTTRFWSGQAKDGIELSVILMDLEMPVMDGLTCARRIRELEVDGTLISHVPIIAVTANARLEQIETAIGAGMDDVVSKPFRIPDLIPKMQELVLKSSNNT